MPLSSPPTPTARRPYRPTVEEARCPRGPQKRTVEATRKSSRCSFWFVWCDFLLILTALSLVGGQSVYGSWSLESTVSDSVAQAAGGFGPASGINSDSCGDHVAYALRAATGSSLFSLNSRARGLRTEACWRLSISISLACVSQVSLQTQ